jgi:pimeloyl-ACP methyl ester carboxylesterase
VAFIRRDWHRVVRVLRPEFGMLPHSLGRERLARHFWSLFADRDLVDPSLADIVVDEFERIYRSPGARLAFLASARAIYLEKPFGRGGFYPRLAGLRPPALFVWSSHDRVIPERFRPHVERWLPGAEQVVLEGCGHVPQVERPERTNPLIARFFARADALGPGIAGMQAA